MVACCEQLGAPQLNGVSLMVEMVAVKWRGHDEIEASAKHTSGLHSVGEGDVGICLINYS